MSPPTPLEQLLSQCLRNLFSPETHRLRGLRRIASRVTDERLREAMLSLAALGELHLARLDLIAHRHRIKLTERGAHGMAGILEGIDEADPLFPSPRIADLYYAGLVGRCGAYLRSVYRSALSLSVRPGWAHAAASLEANLSEENETAGHLAAFSNPLPTTRTGQRFLALP
ncbi:MAG: DUF892 family protein [Verrucomicrobiales bacterium]|nr:DUF892 family protein [Verrucomicrobiales bacterium]